MSEQQIIGIMVVGLVPLVVAIAAIVKPIIALNSTLVRLNVTMEHIEKENKSLRKMVCDHEERLDVHEIILRQRGELV